MWLDVYYNLVWLLAGFLTGLTSFGGNLFAVPLLALNLPPREAILFGSISGTAIFIGLAFVYLRHILWKEALIIVVSALGGIPIGIWFLANAGAKFLLLVAGASLSLFLIWQFALLFLHKSEKPLPVWCAVPCGLLSGLMMSAVTFGGPPLALYAFLRHWNKEQTLGTINIMSIGMMFFVLPSIWSHGLFTPQLLRLGLYGSLASLLGIVLSISIAYKLKQEIFRLLLTVMLVFAAIMLLWRGIMA